MAVRAGPTTTVGTMGARTGPTHNCRDDSCRHRTRWHTTTIGTTAAGAGPTHIPQLQEWQQRWETHQLGGQQPRGQDQPTHHNHGDDGSDGRTERPTTTVGTMWEQDQPTHYNSGENGSGGTTTHHNHGNDSCDGWPINRGDDGNRDRTNPPTTTVGTGVGVGPTHSPRLRGWWLWGRTNPPITTTGMMGVGAGPTSPPQLWGWQQWWQDWPTTTTGMTAVRAGLTHPPQPRGWQQQWQDWPTHYNSGDRSRGRTDLHHNLWDDGSGGRTNPPTTILGIMAVGAGPVDLPQLWGKRQWGNYYQSGEGVVNIPIYSLFLHYLKSLLLFWYLFQLPLFGLKYLENTDIFPTFFPSNTLLI